MGDLWRALGCLRKYWLVTLGAFTSLLVVTLINLITPQILQVLINRGISASNLSVILYGSLLLLRVAGIRNLFAFTQGFWSEKASQSAAYEMRNVIFARLENLSFSYYDQAQTGQLMTRVTSDVDTVRNFTGNGLLQLVNAIVMLFGSAIILLLTNWRLALIVLTIVPAVLSIFLFFLRRIGPRFRLVQQKQIGRASCRERV